MVATGVAFAARPRLSPLLLVVAFAGTINPSAGSVSVFVPLEHAVLAREVADARAHQRCSPATAWSARWRGRAARWPRRRPTCLAAARHRPARRRIKAMFVLYALLGVAGGLLYARIPRRPPPPSARPARGARAVAAASSTGSPRCSASTPSPAASSSSRCWRSGCSSASTCRSPPPACSSSGRACSRPSPSRSPPGCRGASASINTMVFTHIPSSICLIAGGRSRRRCRWRSALLLVRAALSQMDVPTRSSYVMAVVTAGRAAGRRELHRPCRAASPPPPARRSPARCSPPRSRPGRSLICGALKIVYDLLLLVQFRHVKPPEEQ